MRGFRNKKQSGTFRVCRSHDKGWIPDVEISDQMAKSHSRSIENVVSNLVLLLYKKQKTTTASRGSDYII